MSTPFGNDVVAAVELQMSFSGWIVGPMGQWCQQRFNAMVVISFQKLVFSFTIQYVFAQGVFILVPLAVGQFQYPAVLGHQKFRWVGAFECIELDIMHE